MTADARLTVRLTVDVSQAVEALQALDAENRAAVGPCAASRPATRDDGAGA